MRYHIATLLVICGLRDYGLPPLLWGGDAGCEHEWGDELRKVAKVTHGTGGSTLTGGHESWGNRDGGTQGSFCLVCSCWRGSLGLEPTPELYVEHIVEVFREVRRVLRDDGTVWLNLGDSYASSAFSARPDGKGIGITGDKAHQDIPRPPVPSGLKPKDLCGIPWRVAFALQADGWWLRSAITWCKGSPMPESCRDRPTSATEMIFLLSKSKSYFYDIEAGREFANLLNPSNAVHKKGFAVKSSSALSVAAKGGNVSDLNKLFPYLKLACLLASQRISLEKRNDLFRCALRILKTPMTDRVAMLARLITSEDAAQIVLYILEQWRIIIAKLNLETEPELWVRFSETCSDAIVSIKATLTIEETSEVISKIIANAQLIRNAIPLDTLLECSVDVDLIDQSVSLFDCAESLSSENGDSLVADSTLQQLALALDDLRVDLGASSIGHQSSFLPLDSTTDKPNGQTGRNLWNWWVINARGYKGAHFATFAPAIPSICIQLSTSERGCCPSCGAGWVRTVRKSTTFEGGSGKAGRTAEEVNASGKWAGKQYGTNLKLGPVNSVQTTGWRPGCGCGGDPVPAVCLDPFSGSGTVGLVAARLGRDSILCELSEEYAEMARKRIKNDSPMFNEVEVIR